MATLKKVATTTSEEVEKHGSTESVTVSSQINPPNPRICAEKF
jgi:hypothetical protein